MILPRSGKIFGGYVGRRRRDEKSFGASRSRLHRCERGQRPLQIELLLHSFAYENAPAFFLLFIRSMKCVRACAIKECVHACTIVVTYEICPSICSTLHSFNVCLACDVGPS